jgi:hypothetical protein
VGRERLEFRAPGTRGGLQRRDVGGGHAVDAVGGGRRRRAADWDEEAVRECAGRAQWCGLARRQERTVALSISRSDLESSIWSSFIYT